VIIDRHLVQSAVKAGELCSDFGLDPESVAADWNRSEEVTTKDLRTCAHIREVEIGREIRKGGKEAVADLVRI